MLKLIKRLFSRKRATYHVRLTVSTVVLACVKARNEKEAAEIALAMFPDSRVAYVKKCCD